MTHSRLGMVSTASASATRAGREVLAAGGNAADAAVAAAFCLGVTEPAASGLGGQSMALVHLAERRRSFALDGSSRAPFAVDPMNVPRKPSRVGLVASTVPSTPAALGYLQETYGQLELADVLAPAIRAAEEGYRATALLRRLVKKEREELSRDPLSTRIFLPGGEPIARGEIVRQPELAACLRRLASEGWRDFYLGSVAEDIVRDMAERGGLVSPADLKQIPLPVERPVLESRYRGHKLVTFPPPGAGRALVEILNVFECFEPEELDLATTGANVLAARVFSNAMRDRDERPVDPDLYLQARKRRMMDKRYAERVAERIRKLPAVGSPSRTSDRPLRGETTHLCAADAEGNVVAITQSIELVFGAKRQNPTQGFFYNNYINAFEYRDMTHPYYLLPGAIPWSSVAPTLLFDRGRPWLTLGSPGTERIATALAQVVTRVVDAGEDLGRAIEAPRFHASGTQKVQIEAKRYLPETVEALRTAGFDIRRRGAYSFYLGCVQAIQLPRNRREDYEGVADPRRDGIALGPDSQVPS